MGQFLRLYALHMYFIIHTAFNLLTYVDSKAPGHILESNLGECISDVKTYANVCIQELVAAACSLPLKLWLCCFSATKARDSMRVSFLYH